MRYDIRLKLIYERHMQAKEKKNNNSNNNTNKENKN